MNITYTTQEELDELLTLLSQQYEEVMLAKKTKKQKTKYCYRRRVLHR